MPSLLEDNRVQEVARETEELYSRAKIEALQDFRELKIDDENQINARLATAILHRADRRTTVDWIGDLIRVVFSK